VIIVGSDGTGLFRISANGGVAVPLTIVDWSAGELGHTLPQFLPDGRRFLFLIRSTDTARAGIYISSLEAPGSQTRILDLAGEARYVHHYLLFSKARALFARPFDVQSLRFSGDAVRIADATAYNVAGGRAGFSVSENGVLAYQAATPKVLSWFDSSGRRLNSVTAGDFDDPVISRDGTRIALAKFDPQTGRRSLWVSSNSRSLLRRLEAPGPWNEIAPVWSPSGDRLIFASDRSGHFDLYARSLEGGDEQPIFQSPGDKLPLDWSPDGRVVLFRGGGSPAELWELPLDGRRPVSLARTDPVLSAAQLSPDGRWLAFVSSEVGGGEVFITPFPSGVSKVQISSGGGGEPRWSSDGRKLFYLTRSGTLMSVTLDSGGPLRSSPPVPLFQTNVAATVFIGAPARNQYDVADNGQRFLISEPPELISSTPMTIVLNWMAAFDDK
jgi:dipeptidyl aminopeptidase/acylaminoacyl peptidase